MKKLLFIVAVALCLTAGSQTLTTETDSAGRVVGWCTERTLSGVIYKENGPSVEFLGSVYEPEYDSILHERCRDKSVAEIVDYLRRFEYAVVFEDERMVFLEKVVFVEERYESLDVRFDGR